MVVGSNFDESHVSILNHLMSKMLADVDVLSTLASADDVVSPFDARRVVFIDWSIIVWFETHIVEQIAKVDNLDRHFGSSVLFCFGGR